MRRGVHEGVRCVADTRLHNRSDEQAVQFDRQTGVGNMVRGVEAETCTRRVSQVVVTIAGVVEADHVVRKCRSHGPVLPVSMVKHVHWIIRSAIILFGLQSVQLSGSTQIHLGEFFSLLRQEGGQDLEPEILLIPIAVGAPLLHAPLEPTGTCLA